MCTLTFKVKFWKKGASGIQVSMACIISWIVMFLNPFHLWVIICKLFSEPDVPDHDLEPPRFSRRALERLLNDWSAVRGMIMSGE
jgi:hypothetical protein